MLLLYNILYSIFVLCFLPVLLIREKYRRSLLIRLGILPQSLISKIAGQPVIWLHTVSVGEVLACRGLIKDLQQQYRNFRLVISTVTGTGNSIARKLVRPEDAVIYSPLDVSLIVKRVGDIINPRLFIIAETEIWPNIVMHLAKKAVPIILLNGRVSANSLRGYKIIRRFLKQVLRNFSLFCMQTQEDARRIIDLGADKDKVKVTGNMKFDIRMSGSGRQKSDLGLSEKEQLFIAGSTHRGEERIILQVYRELIKEHLNLRLLIAPRHIERVPEIERLISRLGFNAQRVSRLGLTQRPQNHRLRPVLVLDSVGQLNGLYALAEVVFIGGSLVAHGGQNPIEPAVFARAIIFGPAMSNFSQIVKVFLSKKAAIMVKDARQLKDICSRLLNQPALRKELGRAARELVLENQGTTSRNIGLIQNWLKR